MKGFWSDQEKRAESPSDKENLASSRLASEMTHYFRRFIGITGAEMPAKRAGLNRRKAARVIVTFI
jgi:hypothetical protein